MQQSEQSATRRRTWRAGVSRFIAAVALVVAAGCAGGDQPSDDCQAALEHDIELRLQSARAKSPDLADTHRNNLMAAGGAYLARCHADWSAQRIECTRNAETLDALAACN